MKVAMPRALGLALLLLTASAACQARPPSRLETAVATQLKRRITVGGRGDVSPLGDALFLGGGRKLMVVPVPATLSGVGGP